MALGGELGALVQAPGSQVSREALARLGDGSGGCVSTSQDVSPRIRDGF